jgi:hypothetical protein
MPRSARQILDVSNAVLQRLSAVFDDSSDGGEEDQANSGEVDQLSHGGDRFSHILLRTDEFHLFTGKDVPGEAPSAALLHEGGMARAVARRIDDVEEVEVRPDDRRERPGLRWGRVSPDRLLVGEEPNFSWRARFPPMWSSWKWVLTIRWTGRPSRKAANSAAVKLQPVSMSRPSTR